MTEDGATREVYKQGHGDADAWILVDYVDGKVKGVQYSAF